MQPSRRTFIQGLFLGSAAVSCGLLRGQTALAASSLAVPGGQLAGRHFKLAIAASRVNFTGTVRPAITVNGSLPAPTLRWREGDTVTLEVSNQLPAHTQTSLHWHGILLPANMDGVPGMSFDGIYPGQTFRYQFNVRQSGTYWYHSHSLHQEQAGLYGALIIDPKEPAPYAFDREHVVLLSDWTDLTPDALFARLKKMPSYDNYYQRTFADFWRDVARDGFSATAQDRWDWGRMRMTPTDISDVNAHTYTYLINGVSPAGNWTGLFAAGEKVLLRFINAANMTHFDIRIPGLKMTVVAADGQYVHPVTVDEFRLGVAETLDVLVEPQGQEAFTVFAQDMGRTGFACGTLAVRGGLRAPIPPLDARPLLTMADMGHGSGSHAGHAVHGGHAAHGQASTDNNPLVDMRTGNPAPRLDDPGIGLRNNGRRVLTYADLHSLFADPDGREPGREIDLHLTGHMEKFSWSFDGVPFSEAQPLPLRYGERVRLRLTNDTMMQHPIHLHGMWSDLEDENTHHRHAARQRAQLSCARRCAGALGVSLPPALPHGRRHDARSARGRKRMKRLIQGFALCTLASFALAQSHDHDHSAQGKPAAANACSPEHAAMGHCQLPSPSQKTARPACSAEHAAMGHCKLPAAVKNAPSEPREPIPAVTEQDRLAAFPKLQNGHQHASNRYWLARFDKLEGWDGGQAWEASFKYGGDIERLLLQSEGERSGGKTESADLSAFYSRSITPWWDAYIGLRQEFEPSQRTFAAAGISGTPFYALELSATLYATASGQWLGKFNADYDLRLTNRLILQPSLEAKAALKNERGRAIGSGLNSTESGLRLRYEITREFAPYLGLVHEQLSGKTADFTHERHEHSRDTRWVFGVKLWF